MWYLAQRNLYTANEIRSTRVDGSFVQAKLVIPAGTVFELEDTPQHTKFLKLYPDNEALIRNIAKNDVYSGRGDANTIVVEGDIDNIFTEKTYADLTDIMAGVEAYENGVVREQFTGLDPVEKVLYDHMDKYRKIYAQEEERIYPEVLRKYSTVQEDELSYLAWDINQPHDWPADVKDAMEEGFSYATSLDDGMEVIYGFDNRYVSDKGIVDFTRIPGYRVYDPDTKEFYDVPMQRDTLEQRKRTQNSLEKDFRDKFESSPARDLSKVPSRIEVDIPLREVTDMAVESLGETNEVVQVVARGYEFIEKMYANNKGNSLTIDAFLTEGGQPKPGFVYDVLYNGDAPFYVGINESAFDEAGHFNPEAAEFDLYNVDTGELTETVLSDLKDKTTYTNFIDEALEDTERTCGPIEQMRADTSEVSQAIEEGMVAEGRVPGKVLDQHKFNQAVAEENDKSARNIEDMMKNDPKISRLDAAKMELENIHKDIDKSMEELRMANIEIRNATAAINTQTPGARELLAALNKRREEINQDLDKQRSRLSIQRKEVMKARIDIPVNTAIQKSNAFKAGVNKVVDKYKEATEKMKVSGLIAYAKAMAAVNEIPRQIERYTLRADERAIDQLKCKLKDIKTHVRESYNSPFHRALYGKRELTPEKLEDLLAHNYKYQHVKELFEMAKHDVFIDQQNERYFGGRAERFLDEKVVERALKVGMGEKVNKAKEGIKDMQERNDKSVDTDAKMFAPVVDIDARLKNARESVKNRVVDAKVAIGNIKDNLNEMKDDRSAR